MYLCGYLDTFSQAGQIYCPSQVVYTYTGYDASPSMRLPMLVGSALDCLRRYSNQNTCFVQVYPKNREFSIEKVSRDTSDQSAVNSNGSGL